jgi:alpha-tubulin suppressor-like RCC1 family protein
VVAGIANATTVSCGYSHTCVVLNDGEIQCWGDDGGSPGGGDATFGALGNPSVTRDCKWVINTFMSYETTCSLTPVPVSGIANAVTVAAGDLSTCAVLADGSVECWGWNLDGQLGNRSTSNSVVPVAVMADFGQ